MHPVYELRHHPILSHDLNIKRKEKPKGGGKFQKTDRTRKHTMERVSNKKRLKEIDKQKKEDAVKEKKQTKMEDAGNRWMKYDVK